MPPSKGYGGGYDMPASYGRPAYGGCCAGKAGKGGKGGGSASQYVGQRLHGSFKSFNVEKGWGFLRCPRFADDIFVSYKLAPQLQGMGPLEGVAASFVVNPSKSNSGSFEAQDVNVEMGGGYAPMGGGYAPMGGGYSSKGAASYGAVKGGSSHAAAGPYGGMKGCQGKGSPFSGAKTGQSSSEGTSFIGQVVEGVIKSFSPKDSWGFVNSDAFVDDCFFAMRTNPHLDSASVVPGTRVSFTVQASQKRVGALEAIDIGVGLS